MADQAPPETAGKPRTGHTGWATKTNLAIGAAGLVLAYLVFRRSSASPATTSSAPATGNPGAGAGLDTSFVGQMENQIAGLSQDFASLQAQQASDSATLGAQQSADEAANAGLFSKISDSLSGISNKLASVGNQVAPATAPQGLSTEAINSLLAHGESIVDQTPSTGGGTLFLTNKGGVYTSGGAPLFGQQSYLGYAASTSNPAAEIAGHGNFSTGHIQALAGGHYTETNNLGENYTF